jgi:RimJ/RimL family protein N-acetyltransferase
MGHTLARVPLFYPAPPLADGVVLLRRWELADLPTVAEASADGDAVEGTTLPSAYTDAEGREWIERQWSRLESGEGLSLALEADGRAAGAIVLVHRDPESVGIGYWLVRSARGRGLAGRAVRLLAPWALREAGMRRVEALVEPGNEASIRTVLGAGFAREGLLRSHARIGARRADVIVFSLVADDTSRV